MAKHTLKILRWSVSYTNQSIDLLCKSMDWILYDRDLRHKRFNLAFLFIALNTYLLVRIVSLVSKVAKNESPILFPQHFPMSQVLT